jgi:hypothetical protein
MAPFASPSGLSAVVKYNGDTLFDGSLSAVADQPESTRLTMRATLGGKLERVISWEASQTTAPAVAKAILQSIGMTVHSSFDGAASADAAAGALVSCYYGLADNVTIAQALAELADVSTADVFVLAGVVYWVPYQPPYTGYPIAKADTTPSVIGDGSALLQNAYSIRHLFDGQVPATGGTGDKVWAFDGGNTSRVQIYGYTAASVFGARRLAARGTARPVYRVKIRPGAAPVVPGDWYACSVGQLVGDYQLVAYSTDGKTYDLEVR